MCIRDSRQGVGVGTHRRVGQHHAVQIPAPAGPEGDRTARVDGVKCRVPVSYTHLRAHETVLDLVCRLLLEKKKNK